MFSVDRGWKGKTRGLRRKRGEISGIWMRLTEQAECFLSCNKVSFSDVDVTDEFVDVFGDDL